MKRLNRLKILGGAIPLVLLLFAACCPNQSHDAAVPLERDRELLEFFKGLYEKTPAGSPARFAVNEMATRYNWQAFSFLRGEWPSTKAEREQARERLTELKGRIQKGLAWPYQTPPSFEIPRAPRGLEINGSLDEAGWSDALTFHGAYFLNSSLKANDGSVWKLMWDRDFLYAGVYFPDSHVLASPRIGHPYDGDSFEIFIMPSKRMKAYWELIVGCEGDLYDGFHCNNRYGGWASNPFAEMDGLKFKSSKCENGFVVEMAIPFRELPNYMLGNPPVSGQSIRFALLRTDLDPVDAKVRYSSPFPLLYGGHNIFGHAIGIFQ